MPKTKMSQTCLARFFSSSILLDRIPEYLQQPCIHEDEWPSSACACINAGMHAACGESYMRYRISCSLIMKASSCSTICASFSNEPPSLVSACLSLSVSVVSELARRLDLYRFASSRCSKKHPQPSITTNVFYSDHSKKHLPLQLRMALLNVRHRLRCEQLLQHSMTRAM